VPGTINLQSWQWGSLNITDPILFNQFGKLVMKAVVVEWNLGLSMYRVQVRSSQISEKEAGKKHKLKSWNVIQCPSKL